MNASAALIIVAVGLLIILVLESARVRYTVLALWLALHLVLRGRVREAWILARLWFTLVRLPADDQPWALAGLEREHARRRRARRNGEGEQ